MPGKRACVRTIFFVFRALFKAKSKAKKGLAKFINIWTSHSLSVEQKSLWRSLLADFARGRRRSNHEKRDFPRKATASVAIFSWNRYISRENFTKKCGHKSLIITKVICVDFVWEEEEEEEVWKYYCWYMAAYFFIVTSMYFFFRSDNWPQLVYAPLNGLFRMTNLALQLLN